MEKKRFLWTTVISFILVWFLFFSKLCDAGIEYVLEWSHTVIIKSNDSMWACGNNSYGQLGDGTQQDKYILVQIGTGTDWSAVALGGYHSLGLKSDGSLWVWGRNLDYQLGDGTTESKNVPTGIKSGTTWVAVAGGSYHSVGIRSDGTLWSWGGNSYGQLGDGTNVTRYVPTQIGTDTNWSNIVAGSVHTVALKTDGSLYAWGYNMEGQLGDGTGVNKRVPTLIGSDKDWVAVVAGGYHTLGLKSDGSLYAWGSNWYGQLGDGTTTSRLSPVRVGTDKYQVAVSAGSYHTLGLKSDGSLYTWGDNSYGQLGDGTTTSRLSPVRVGTDKDWIMVKAIGNHNFACKTDGSIWSWGDNTYGQLGDGTTSGKNVPTFISGGVVPPVFSPSPGAYAASQDVTITCDTPGANIYYTTDGSEPDESSNLYSGPIAITTATTLKAKAYKSGWDYSLVIDGYYFITGTADTVTYDITGGEAATSYLMVSSPLTPEDPDILANLINFLGPYDPTNWRLFVWDPTLDPPDYDEYPFVENEIKPGWSAWFISRNDVTVELTGSLLDPAEPYLVSLRPGWNQIGAPFIFPVAWEEVMVKDDEVSYCVNSTENTLTSHTLWKYEDEEYVSSNYLIPTEGYWIKNLASRTVDLSIPPSPCEVPTGSGGGGPSLRALESASASEEEKPPAPPGAALDSSGSSSSGGGGCFIATACYGSPLAEEVSVLREFRDRYLLTNTVGAILSAVYYRYSPWLASFLEGHELPKMAVRALLSPVVKGCKIFLMQAQ